MKTVRRIARDRRIRRVMPGPPSAGQAMTEYAVVMMGLLFGGGLLLGKFMPYMMKHYQIYIDGFMMVLSLPIP